MPQNSSHHHGRCRDTRCGKWSRKYNYDTFGLHKKWKFYRRLILLVCGFVLITITPEGPDVESAAVTFGFPITTPRAQVCLLHSSIVARADRAGDKMQVRDSDA